MLRFVICEDNKQFINRINLIINKYMIPKNYAYKTNKFTKYNEELKEIIENKNDEKIYILDIELPYISGLEIASEIREEDDTSPIIFITSHPEFQNDIFYSRLLAIDFINKDMFWPERFEETIKYTFENINKNKIFSFEYNYNSYRIPINKILYIEKIQDNPKYKIVMENGDEYEIISTISKLKEKLGHRFYQSHKSCLVNVEQIKKINYGENTITFNNNKSIYLLSNRHKKGIKEYVANY